MRKIKLFTIISLIVLIIVTFGVLFEHEILTNLSAPLLWQRNVSCYFLRSNGILELGSGEWDEAMLIPDRCIFFLETSCFGIYGTSDAIIDKRISCAIESAANINPSMNIFLLYLTPKRFSKYSSILIDKIEGYENIYVRRINLVSYFSNTPLENWYLKNMRIILSNKDSRRIIFELVRIATLWKYGGFFVDLGLILDTPLDTFMNLIVKRKNQSDSTALLGIGISTDQGKQIADFAVNEVIHKFDKSISAVKIIEKFCRTDTTKKKRNCEKFETYSNTKEFSTNKNSTKNCPKIYEKK